MQMFFQLWNYEKFHFLDYFFESTVYIKFWREINTFFWLNVYMNCFLGLHKL